jgi:hypothetical protein
VHRPAVLGGLLAWLRSSKTCLPALMPPSGQEQNGAVMSQIHLQPLSPHSRRKGRARANHAAPRQTRAVIARVTAACGGLAVVALFTALALGHLSVIPVNAPAARSVTKADTRPERPDLSPPPMQQPPAVPFPPDAPLIAEPAPAPPAPPAPVPPAPVPAPAAGSPSVSDDVGVSGNCTEGQCTACLNGACRSLPDVLPGGISMPTLPRIPSKSGTTATTCINGACVTKNG